MIILFTVQGCVLEYLVRYDIQRGICTGLAYNSEFSDNEHLESRFDSIHTELIAETATINLCPTELCKSAKRRGEDICIKDLDEDILFLTAVDYLKTLGVDNGTY